MFEFYMDVRDIDGYDFYYNVNKEVNEHVQAVLGKELLDKLPNSEKDPSLKYGDYARMGVMNRHTGELEILEHFQMKGITATVSRALAEKVIERAQYYCPVKDDILRQSFRIEDLENGKCRIYNDCPYAWYVHEFTWRHHDPPTCDHFLTKAIYEIEKEYGYGWA